MQLTIRWSPPDRHVHFSLAAVRHFHFSLAAARLDRLRCALLGGHDDELVVDERVIALRCRRCSWRSPGWHLDCPVRKPVRPYEDADRASPVSIALRPPASV